MNTTTPKYPHNYSAPIVIEPTAPHTHTFILLHGRGSDPNTFGNVLLQDAYIRTGVITGDEHAMADRQKLQSIYPSVKFIFPAAKRRRAVEFNRTYVTQWFDLRTLSDPPESEGLQTDGIKESCAYIHFIIRQELRNTGILPERIVLGGLSQGFATALFALLTLDADEENERELAGLQIPRLGAFIGMSGWIPFERTMKETIDGIYSESDPDISFEDSEHPEKSQDIPKDIQALNAIRDLIYLHPLPPDTPPACLNTPVFLGHGDADDIVPVHCGESAKDILGRLTMDVTWRVYPGFGHWYLVPDEIEDIVQFLHREGVISPRVE